MTCSALPLSLPATGGQILFLPPIERLIGESASLVLGRLLPLFLGLIPAAHSPLPFLAGIAMVENADQENCPLSLGSMFEACKGLGIYEGRVEDAAG